MASTPKTNLFTVSQVPSAQSFSYYEYKYLVPHEYLAQIYQMLEEFYGLSDPYSEGIVDSIYYDNISETCYDQCLNGEADKVKFRIRGYGDNTYGQVHEKMKRLSSVAKYKSKIIPVSTPGENAPDWNTLQPAGASSDFYQIMHHARSYGQLYPSIRIKYHRFRYRIYDYRMTLDTHIEVFAPTNGLPRSVRYATLPYHVLEIKTSERRPNLPFIGLIKLRQVSFSKFMLGLGLLTTSAESEFTHE